MPPPVPQSAANLPSHARYGVRAVDTGNDQQRLMAKPCTLHLHCAARAALRAANLQCRGSRGTPLAFLWGFKRGYSLRKENTPFAPCSAIGAATSPPLVREIKREHSLRKENTPFDKAAPIHTSILTPCVSMVMMHPAMVTPRKMTGTARFKRISSTAAMSAPVHAPVPGSGMATKSSSPHV